MVRKKRKYHKDITSPGKEFWNTGVNPITGYRTSENRSLRHEKTDVYLPFPSLKVA